MEQREKKYVPVIVRFDTDGKMRPMEIEFSEGQKYPVDQILDVCRAACQSVGGVGDRYTCRIQGKESYLWFEKGRCSETDVTEQILYPGHSFVVY